jgi:4'-phosphopantetheinyl transferase
VAPRYFTPVEANELAQLPEEQRPTRFYALWTLKESWLKATGEGLAGGLDQVSFQFGDTRFGAGVVITGDDVARWRFWQALPSKEHLLALALRSALERVEVSLYRLDPAAELRGTPLARPRLVAPLSDQEQGSQA